jgi:hypothetical protein
MLLSGSADDTETLLNEVPTLVDTLREKTGVFTWSLSHAVTANSGTSDKVIYFGASPVQEANETGADRYFYFPSALKVVGIVSTVSVLSPGQGTKNASDATMGLQNATTGEFFNLHVSHDYSKSYDVVRGAGRNIVVKGSDKYRIRVAIPGYSQANPSNYTHQITLLLENLIPNIYYCGFEQGDAALQFNLYTSQKKFSRYGSSSIQGNVYGNVGRYLIRPVPVKVFGRVPPNSNNFVLSDPAINPSTVTLNDPPPANTNAILRCDELGVEFSSYPTIVKRPYFNNIGSLVTTFDPSSCIAAVPASGSSGNYVNYPGYSEWWESGINVSNKYRLGAKSVRTSYFPYDTPDSQGNGYFAEAFTFAVARREDILYQLNNFLPQNWYFLKVRIGVLIDTVGDPQYCPDYISVVTTVDSLNGVQANTFSEKLPKNGIPKLVVFELDCAPNFVFRFNFWKVSPAVFPNVPIEGQGPNSTMSFSAVTID